MIRSQNLIIYTAPKQKMFFYLNWGYFPTYLKHACNSVTVNYKLVFACLEFCHEQMVLSLHQFIQRLHGNFLFNILTCYCYAFFYFLKYFLMILGNCFDKRKLKYHKNIVKLLFIILLILHLFAPSYSALLENHVCVIRKKI